MNSNRLADYNGGGLIHLHGMAPLESDAGIVQALVEAKRYLFLAVGHNHGNDYFCPYHSSSENNNNNSATIMDETARREHFSSAFHLCFGRHSGYGGYGKGARVFELKNRIRFHDAREKGEPHNEERNSIRWKSWVRLESGEIIDQV
ncbi:unnamed protein product [Cylindrotheca closterium]|uniref:Calcineurin-like phosphoesterase domain-containing protein n=1 Tax=Cylindrotheca closterium TaxID=2856 RepID=A0AAD2CGM8_9STRA|nr:unnamed protein product [Cylindrotheca closterium]